MPRFILLVSFPRNIRSFKTFTLAWVITSSPCQGVYYFLFIYCLRHDFSLVLDPVLELALTDQTRRDLPDSVAHMLVLRPCVTTELLKVIIFDDFLCKYHFTNK